MLLPTTVALPDYDQGQIDRRFLIELDRLLDVGAFPSYRDWAETVAVSPSYIHGIERGRYHCNLRLLYLTLQYFPVFDFAYVVFGPGLYGRPEPTHTPKRQRGPKPKTPVAP